MFGIGGGEFLFIIFIVLMFFGSDKIPELARALGKGMAQLRNATNDIKNEIRTGAADAGLDRSTLTGGISDEIAKAKESFTTMVSQSNEAARVDDVFSVQPESPAVTQEPSGPDPVENQPDGPIKRQR